MARIPTPGARPRRRALAAAGAVLSVALATVGIVAATGGAQAATTNLVQNPGFESGALSPWTCTSNSGAVVSSPVHAGSHALQGTPSNSDDAQCSQTISVVPSSAYTLSAYVDGSYVYLGDTGTGGTDTSTWTPGTGGGYQQLTTSFTTGASTTSLTIWVHGWYAQPAYFVDDVSLAGPGGSGGSPSPSPSATSKSPSPSPSPSASPSKSPSPSASPTGCTSNCGGTGKHLLTGYWQDFTNPAPAQRLSGVNSQYDIIAVAFANATGTPGQISFSLDSGLSSALGGYSDAQFKADIAAKHAAGKKVILSVGGQNGTDLGQRLDLGDQLRRQRRLDHHRATASTASTSTWRTASTPRTWRRRCTRWPARAAWARTSILTLAPQTIDMQSTGGAYFQLALNVKDILTIVNMQYYNSGTMLGCDGQVYAEGTENFLTALACIQLQGGLDPSQVGLGVPASTSAAPAAATSARASSTRRSTASPAAPTAAPSSRRRSGRASAAR